MTLLLSRYWPWNIVTASNRRLLFTKNKTQTSRRLLGERVEKPALFREQFNFFNNASTTQHLPWENSAQLMLFAVRVWSGPDQETSGRLSCYLFSLLDTGILECGSVALWGIRNCVLCVAGYTGHCVHTMSRKLLDTVVCTAATQNKCVRRVITNQTRDPVKPLSRFSGNT
jgi:hypothetical protein